MSCLRWFLVIAKRVLAFIVIALGLFAIVFGLITPRQKDEAIGIVWVNGDSMEEFPNGSCVFGWKLEPWSKCYVIADGRPDKPESLEDRKWGRIVKRYDGSKLPLQSTATEQSYSNYKIRSVVIFWLPMQKIAWWRDVGIQKTDRSVKPNRKLIDEFDNAMLAATQQFREFEGKPYKCSLPIAPGGSKSLSDSMVIDSARLGPGESLTITASEPFSSILICYKQSWHMKIVDGKGKLIKAMGVNTSEFPPQLIRFPATKVLTISQEPADTGVFLDLYEIAVK